MADAYSNTEIVRIASEWLDANKSRAYPFDEHCADAPNRIPSEVFTDAFFAVTGLDYESLYVSKVVQGPSSFQVYVRTESKDIGLLADIPYDTPERTQLSVDIDAGDGVSLSGLLVVGNALAIKSMMPTTDMDIDSGKFFNGCVRDFTAGGVQGIRVGDTVYRGVVDIVAGPGISLSTETDEHTGETRITVAALAREIPEDNLIIQDDVTLLAELNALAGPSVSTINGVEPDSNGNIMLSYPTVEEIAEGVEEVRYVPFSAANATITLKTASESAAVCDEDALLDTIMSNIAELNNRAARLAETTDAIDTANNVMSISLSRIS